MGGQEYSFMLSMLLCASKLVTAVWQCRLTLGESLATSMLYCMKYIWKTHSERWFSHSQTEACIIQLPPAGMWSMVYTCTSPSDCRLALFESKAINKLRFALHFVPPQSEGNTLLARYFIFLASVCSNSPSELPCMHIAGADGCISNAGFTLIKTAQLKRSFRCRLLPWVERDRMVYWSQLMSATRLEFNRKVCCDGRVWLWFGLHL